MSSPARTLLDKLQAADLGRHGRRVRVSTHQCLLDFLAHLRWLESRHLKKRLSDEYLLSSCFGRPRVLRTDAEVNAFCRAHLSLAIIEFEALLKIIRGKETTISYRKARQFKDHLWDYLFDLRPIAEHLEKKRDATYEFFNGGKTSYVPSWKIFGLSRQLAIQSAYRDSIQLDHRVGQVASVFSLRQALETKFARIIAVALYDKNGQSPRIKHNFHYDFITNHQQFFEFPFVKFESLKRIYDWCNSIVHNPQQPRAWQLSHAHATCEALFWHGPLNTHGGFSIDGGVRVLNLEKMREEYMKYFSHNYDHGIWGAEFYEPEAVTNYYD